tara:strand:- start:3 stop:578 length:576 start_codon:yes stop_codon:yes gene_type:complete
MSEKKIGNFFYLFLFLVILSVIVYSIFFNKKEETKLITQEKEDVVYSSNIIKDVRYVTKDSEGNEFIITAKQGEIDYSNSNILFLTKVDALIKLVDSGNINITSKYGKYNSENFDTIFSKNVTMDYLDNKIIGEYLDFSLERNTMLITKEVIYTNLQNILKADAIEVNLKTKDTKIFMHENQKKINIKSIE